MAKKTATTPAPSKPNEIRIKEDSERDQEYFRQRSDDYVLPPELNMTIKDGFRFGIGFILAMLIFYAIVMVGLILFVRFGKLVNLG